MEKTKLPSIADLTRDEVDVYKHDQLNTLLSAEPSKSWMLKHPYIKDYHYLSIQRVEMLMTMIFQEWKVEVINYTQLFNSVSCHVRLHYKDPITGDWKFHDGLGAVGVQTDKGASASDLTAIKQDAVMKALPASKSYAIKDAAEHLGRLFGRDINRKDFIEFKPQFETKWTQQE